ncbi:2Fe-2S iron-sulfur cluster-binding protein [Nitratireductor sp. XY-223]|uniref:(2Fe-2S)-binding protein n=1 Tax=Nitratireductor sp. XY-223 TaxID=2561926 RepID=UPI00145A4C2D|nr:2Fe-2S iron-sulfur cluster-binding protein [Nitratireductor sp. XY-223]
MEKIDLDFILNGERTTRSGVHANMMLVDFLREELGLTGTKFCCGIAVCRVCTVSVARVPGAHQIAIRACTTPLSDINGKVVTTVEGLDDDGELHSLQQAFLDNFAFQCGYCCPGFLMASYALLDQLKRSPVPRERVDDMVEEAVGQHICRCTGYVRYHRAIRQVILETPGLVT